MSISQRTRQTPPAGASARTHSAPELGKLGSAALAMTQGQRLMTAGVSGAIVGIVIAQFAPWQLAVLGTWDVAAIILVGSIWMFIPILDGEVTRATAMREDSSRAAFDFVVLVASVMSLIGVFLTLIAAKNDSGGMKAWMTSAAVGTVAVSWLTVHTVFTLRYALLYFNDPEGGVDFNEDTCPDYLDFVYLAFTVGMTFQVSDTNISTQTIRRAITRHALLGYVFGTVIIGVTINVVGGLIQ